MIRKSLLLSLMGVLIFTFFIGAQAMAAAKYDITYGSAQKMLVEEKGKDKWQAQEGGKTFTVNMNNNLCKLFENDQLVAQGELKGDKLVIQKAKGGVYLEVKFKAEKIKFLLEPGPNPWEFKYKEDKVKVAMQDKVYGKVHYYKENGKLKVKSESGAEVAEVRGASKLAAAFGVFLVETKDTAKRNFLLLILLALGK